MYKVVLFDLDGTICDTMPDIYNSLCYVLEKNKLNIPSFIEAQSFIGDGLKVFLQRATAYSGLDNCSDDLFNEYFEYYSDNCTNNTVVYDGIYTVLDYLLQLNLSMAVVSNKSQILVRKIITYFNMDKYFNGITFGGDSFTEKKPSSVPILETLKVLNSNPSDNVLIIGDSKNDVLSGKNAGIHTCLCSFGYGDKINNYYPNYTINKAIEIIDILKNYEV